MSALVGAERAVPLPDGTVLDVAETGRGEPLLLVCATIQSHRTWAPLLPALAERYRVLTFDHRGIGTSQRGAGPMTTASLADDAAAVLAALDVERAHVLGWSMGSAVAQELALAHPERVTALVLVATWARADAYQRHLLTLLSHPWRTGRRDVGLVGMGLSYSPELLDSPEFAEMAAATEPLVARTPEQLAAVVEQWDADLAHDTLDRLRGIAAPTLVVAGEQDLLTPPRQGRAVAERIPGARFESLTGPGSSHALLFERSQEFTELVHGFLDGHRRPV